MPNTILKRWNGSSFEELYPKTTVGQISASGTPDSTTFLRGDGQWQIPATQSHSHGNISNAGGWQSSPATIASGDTFVITKSGLLNNASLAFGSGTTTYLRNDGTWGTPAGSGVSGSGTTNQLTYWTGASSIGTLSTATYPSLTELSYVKGVTSAIQTQLGNKLDSTQIVDTYKSTQTTSNSTTPVSYHTITLLPNHYYQIFVQGIWSKLATTASVGAVISVTCNSLTGSPTWHGAFEWLQNTTATAYTVENNVVNLVTSGGTVGFTTTATTGAVGGTYWGMKGLIYTGTTDNKTLTFTIACSTAPTTGSVALDRIAITAVRVS